MSIVDQLERQRAHAETRYVDYYAKALEASAKFRQEYEGRLNVVKASQMPFERSPDGLIKHIIHEGMDTKECCLDIYMQLDRKSTRLNSSHANISYAVFCLKKKKTKQIK